MALTKKTTTTETKEENTVDTQLELLKYATQVKSRIQKNITSDFVLCKLGEQDKQGVINMTVNAYVAERTIQDLIKKAREWQYNHQTETWELGELGETTQKKLTAYKNIIFDTYMTRVQMTAILSRNVSKNYMLDFLKGTTTQDEEPQTTEKKVKDSIIKKKEEPTTPR